MGSEVKDGEIISLVVIVQSPENRDLGRNHKLGDEPVEIGRGTDADFKLNDDHASRRHARLEKRDGTWWVRNLGPVSGTKVNDEAFEERALRDGDRLLLGQTLLLFRTHSAEQSRFTCQAPRTHDELTGAFTRSHLREVFVGEVSRARQTGRPLSLFVFDINQLGQVNDRYTATMGDQLLRMMAELAHGFLGPEELVSRYAGSYFVVLQPGRTLEACAERADALREAIARHTFTFEATTMPGYVSGGCASLEEGQTLEQLVEAALAQLERAKRLGRNCVVSPAYAPRVFLSDDLSVLNVAAYVGRELEFLRLFMTPLSDAEDDGSWAKIGCPPDVALALARYRASEGRTVELDGWVFAPRVLTPSDEIGAQQSGSAERWLIPNDAIVLATRHGGARSWKRTGPYTDSRHLVANPRAGAVIWSEAEGVRVYGHAPQRRGDTTLTLATHAAALVEYGLLRLRRIASYLEAPEEPVDLVGCKHIASRAQSAVSDLNAVPPHLIEGDLIAYVGSLLAGPTAKAWLRFFERTLELAYQDAQEQAIGRRIAREHLRRFGHGAAAIARSLSDAERARGEKLAEQWSTFMDLRYATERMPYAPGGWRRGLT